MDSVKPVSNSPNVVGLVRRFAKALRFRVVSEDRIRKIKYQDNKPKRLPINGSSVHLVDQQAGIEALLAGLFAGISSIKAAYAELQIAQSPYDPDSIQSADEMVVDELKRLSDLKLRYLKKEPDANPQVTVLLAEIQEQNSVLKTYALMVKKMESELKVKDSEISILSEKLEEFENSANVLENLHFSGLNSTHFALFVQHTIQSVGSFVDLTIKEMKSSNWDLVSASESIEPSVVYRRPNHRRFAFEAFVCREIFDGFQNPDFFSHSNQKQVTMKRDFYERFTKLKPKTPRELLLENKKFRRFCCAKYSQVVHPNMEKSFFGDLKQRSTVDSGGYPETEFFNAFAEMAKRVWLLKCLAFSFEPKAEIFQVRKGCRFSEVFMENIVAEEDEEEGSSRVGRVGLVVVPGFKIDKTVVQCQVYLSAAGDEGSR